MPNVTTTTCGRVMPIGKAVRSRCGRKGLSDVYKYLCSDTRINIYNIGTYVKAYTNDTVARRDARFTHYPPTILTVLPY